jgi:hypothetical protein
MAHTCNPSYSGGRDKEDLGSMPAWANSSQDPISKKPISKNGWWCGSGLGSEFKPQYCKKKKRRKKKFKKEMNQKKNWNFPLE